MSSFAIKKNMDNLLRQELSDDRVLLRPLQASDADVLFEAASDPSIWEQHPQRDRYQRPQFDAFFAGALEAPAAFVIIDIASNAVIGSSRFYRCSETERNRYADAIPDMHDAICIGYTFLIPSFWGGTTNRSVKRLMVTRALQRYSTVLFQIGENNLRSRISIERLGATLATARDHVACESSLATPHVLYFIHRSQLASLTF